MAASPHPHPVSFVDGEFVVEGHKLSSFIIRPNTNVAYWRWGIDCECGNQFLSLAGPDDVKRLALRHVLDWVGIYGLPFVADRKTDNAPVIKAYMVFQQMVVPDA